MVKLSEISRIRSKGAFDRIVSERYSGDAVEFVHDVDRSLIRLLVEDLRKANQYFKHVLRLKRFVPERAMPILECTSGRLSFYNGRNKEAAKQYENALRKFRSYRNYRSMARANWGLQFVYAGMGEYEKSIEHGKKALRYFRRKGERDKCAMIMNNIGILYHSRDNNRMARFWIQKSRQFLSEPDPDHEHNLANIEANLGNLREAKRLYENARELGVEKAKPISVLRADYGLAYLHFLNDEFSEALRLFERVADEADRLGDKACEAVTLLDLTEINVHLNQYGSAIAIGQDAIAVCKEMELKYEEAKAEYFISQALGALRESREARKHLKRSSVIFRELDNRLWMGVTGVAFAEHLIAAGEYEKARRQITESLKLLEKSKDERRIADARITLAALKLMSNPTTSHIRSANNLLRRGLVSYQRHRLLMLIGDAFSRRNDSRHAIDCYRRATDTVERMVTSLRNDELGFFFTLDKIESFEKLVSSTLECGDNSSALLNHLKSYSLLNCRVVPDSRIEEEIPPKLLEERYRVLSRLRRLDTTIGDYRAEAQTALGYRRLEERLWRLERKVRSYVSDRSVHGSNQPTLQRIPELESGEALVSYVDLGDKPGAFVCVNGNVRYVELPLSMEQLRRSIREYHFLMESDIVYDVRVGIDDDTIHAYLGTFHEWLITPLRLPDEIERVYLMIDKEFSQVPYLSLENESDQCLCDRYDIHLPVNPLDIETRNRRATISTGSSSSLFEVSNDHLIFIREETEQISQFFPGSRVYSANNATGSNLKRELVRSRGFVHIASHAMRASENPLFSRIHLADGPLFPFDLMSHGINSRLVTLSGCQTAASGIYYGNSFSLARAFYRAGARFVLASLWLVSDRVSSAFMREFYGNLSRQSDIPSAYRSALLKMREEQSRPAFWSPFVLLGI